MSFILPTRQENNNLIISNDVLLSEVESMKVGIDSMEDLSIKLVQSIEKTSEKLANISQPIKNENFDLELIELSRRYAIEVIWLSYSDPSLAFPTVTGDMREDISYDLKEEIELISGKSSTKQPLLVSDYEIMKQEINIEVKGDYQEFKFLIDDILLGYKTMYIKSLDLESETDSYKLVLELYSIEQIKEPLNKGSEYQRNNEK